MSHDDAKDFEFPCNADIPPRVPDGEYEVAFTRADKKYMFGTGERLFLWFRIVSAVGWSGTELYMTCTVAPKGKWGPSHKYYLAWVLAAARVPKRRDRMSTKEFRNKVFLARVRTVTKTAKQSQRTAEQQYSVVDELLRILAGGNCHTDTKTPH